jgi:hypothetical protein
MEIQWAISRDNPTGLAQGCFGMNEVLCFEIHHTKTLFIIGAI